MLGMFKKSPVECDEISSSVNTSCSKPKIESVNKPGLGLAAKTNIPKYIPQQGDDQIRRRIREKLKNYRPASEVADFSVLTSDTPMSQKAKPAKSSPKYALSDFFS